jgi:hypothetical protein
MKTVIKDDRTPEQQLTHRYGVVAKDKFMSGWGRAKDGPSWCAWASDSINDIVKLLEWVRRREEMRHVRVTDLAQYKPPFGTAHFHIYVVNPQHHPAFNEEALQG